MRIVFKISVLNDNDISGRMSKAGSECGTFPHITVMEIDPGRLVNKSRQNIVASVS